MAKFESGDWDMCVPHGRPVKTQTYFLADASRMAHLPETNLLADKGYFERRILMTFRSHSQTKIGLVSTPSQPV